MSAPAAREDLAAQVEELWALACHQGLDPWPTRFDVVTAEALVELAAYGAPGRFQHWSHGKAYQRLKSQQRLGLVQHFELVVPSDPCQAFLLDANDALTNLVVVAHVLGHADFFAHNAHFQAVGLLPAERVHLHGQRLWAYAQRHGPGEVERLLDALLMVEGFVEPVGQAPAVATRREDQRRDRFWDLGQRPVPREPLRREEHDLLRYILEHAEHLAEWQRDVVAMVREEALFFRPQLKTKILNEGWATFWHARLIRALELDDAAYLDFARLHAAVRAPEPGGVNPYRLGAAIFEDVLERLGESRGLERCLEIRETLDDAGFVREHLTPQVAERLGLFTFSYRPEGEGGRWRVTGRDFEAVRDVLVRSRENGGRPVVAVVDQDARETVLEHMHDGRDLHLEDAEQVLAHLAGLLHRRCRLRTMVQGQPRELVAAPP